MEAFDAEAGSAPALYFTRAGHTSDSETGWERVMQFISRRTVLRALAALPAAALAGCVSTQAQTTVYSRLVVDVSPMRALGAGPWADLFQTALTQAMAREFAGRIVPGERSAPILMARINSVSLNSFAGGGGGDLRFGGGEASNDYVDGEVMVVAASGREVLERHPILSAIPSGTAGAWYLPDIDQRRYIALANQFAGWAKRYA